MRYYKTDEAIKATKQKIENLRMYAGIIPTLKETARRFDNKVWNCRLLKAFQEATGQYIMIKQYNDDNYYIYAYDDGQYYTLGRAYKKDMTDGKRINAAALCDSMNNERENMLKEAARTEEQLNNIDNIKNQLDALKKSYETITNSLEYTIIDHFGITQYIR